MLKIFAAGMRGIPDVLGGIETHCRELYPRLAALGCRVTVACRPRYMDYPGKEYLGVALARLPAPGRGGWEAALHTLAALFYARLHGFRILHLHGIGPGIWAPLARLLGMQVVVTHHGADYRRGKWGWAARLVLRFGEWVSVRFAHRVIAIANHIGQHLRQTYCVRQVTVIPNGVPLPLPEPGTDCLARRGLEAGAYFLSVSRFVPEKGLDDLITAWLGLPEPRLPLVLAGAAVQATAYSTRLEKRALESGCVLPGYATGRLLAQLYTHAACFVLPSRHEGLSFALLEAAAYGLPIIASDIPANREPGLTSACFFPAGDTAALTAALLRGQCAQPSRPAARQSLLPPQYHWDTIAGQTLALYRSLAPEEDTRRRH